MLRARDKANAQAAIDDVTEVLKRRHNNQIDFTVISQDDMLATVNSIMAMLTGVLLAIASISLIVGGIGIGVGFVVGPGQAHCESCGGL